MASKPTIILKGKPETDKPAPKPETSKPNANGNSKPKTGPAAPLPEGMLGTKEVAAKLKMEPRRLRVILRASGHGSNGERYAWREADIPKVKAMVDKFEAEAAAKSAETSHADKQ